MANNYQSILNRIAKSQLVKPFYFADPTLAIEDNDNLKPVKNQYDVKARKKERIDFPSQSLSNYFGLEGRGPVIDHKEMEGNKGFYIGESVYY